MSVPTRNNLVNLAIIGAGAGGLAVARHALANSTHFKTTIFEQNDQVGGTWIYTPTPSNSSMYKNLRTNLPKEVMSYSDYSFPTDCSSFLHHSDVLKYLQDYSRHYNILPEIRFSSRVINICSTQTSKWNIEVEETGKKVTRLFDAVAICSGHHSEPRIPTIPEIDKFEGKVVHSHSYREPSDYTGLRVLCLGAGPSGIDICLDICKYASIVYLSHNKAKQFTEYDVPGVVSAKPNGVCLSDGTFLQIDALIFCTGYVYSFPFLSPNCDVTVTDDFVFPLHKHLINAYKPSMAFIGLPFLVSPIPLVELQARFFLNTLLGATKVPPLDIILHENELKNQTLKSKGLSQRFLHCLDDLQWDYNADLAKKAGCKPLEPVVSQIYKCVKGRRETDRSYYRDFNYVIVDSENFTEERLETSTDKLNCDSK